MSYIIEQIKLKISLSSLLIKRGIILKSKTRGEYVALCPFHQEKTPSFHVNDNKGYYHCFGCGVHGDIFSYLMEQENLNFRDALKYLALEANLELDFNLKEKDHRYEIEQKLIQINEYVANYYVDKLFSKEGKIAYAYLQDRGLNLDLIKQHRLGYAPIGNELYGLLRKEYDEKEIIEARVFSLGKYGIYNPLSNRVIFPIINNKNKVIAFGGRVITTAEPKYLNTAETIIFKKSEILYNLNLAKKTAIKLNNIIVVEGYMDVLSLSNQGISNVVAPLGTSIGIKQIQQLWDFIDVPTFCLDADRAGRAASFRTAMNVLPFITSKKTINFIKLINGKDPDEVITKRGLDYFIELQKEPISLADFLFFAYVNAEDLTTPEGRTHLKKNLNSLARAVNDYELSKSYKLYFKEKLFNNLNYYSHARAQKVKSVKTQLIPDIIQVTQQNFKMLTALFAIINHPRLILDEEIFEELQHLELGSNFLDKIREYILNLKDCSHSLGFPCVAEIKDNFINTFNFKLSDDIFDSFVKDQASDDEAKEGITRIFKLNNLEIIQAQIKKMSQLLVEKQDEITYKKFYYLKQVEQDLKKELSLLN